MATAKQEDKLGVLTDVQKAIMKAIETKDVDALKSILSEHPQEDVNFIDDDKMTPLQQAAYRGNISMVEMLLTRGADVNICEHANDYTTLHFGALSGNVAVCHALLSAGVRVNALNSINRTAAQLAGFVGYYNIVSTINNFLPKEDVAYFTRLQGTQTTPYLAEKHVEDLYRFSLIYNMHPMRIAMLLAQYAGLLEDIDSVRKVLSLMSEKESRKKDQSEVMTFKFYYLSFMVGEIAKIVKEPREESKSFVDVFAKKILRVNKQGELEYMDGLIRECVKKYPHIESTLFRQMVASLASEEGPSALSVVAVSVNGQRAFVDEVSNCATCGEEKALKKCAKCKSVSYCERECQKLHWFMHKKMCAALKEQTEKIDAKANATEISNDLQGILAQ